jgi:hypothetical protein
MASRIGWTFVLALASAAHAGVIVVDDSGGPGVGFTSIADAVATAQEGDVVLVHTGIYSPFTVDAKSLVVTSAPGAFVAILGRIRVTGLTPGQAVVLRGLLTGDPTLSHEGLVVEHCAGAVWVEACRLMAAGSNTPGIRVTHAAAVTLVRCQSTGAQGTTVLGDGGPGLHAEGSTIAVLGGSFTGGGGAGHEFGGGEGGAGLRLDASEAWLSGCWLRGGDGGYANGEFNFFCFCYVCGTPGGGGAGLFLENGATARLLDAALAGGLPGLNQESSCPSGQPGQPSQLSPSGMPATLTTLGGEARSLRLESPVIEGQLATLRADGEPGDAVALIVGLELLQKWVPAYAGNLLVVPALLVPLGTVDGEGTLHLDVVMPALPASLEALPFSVQALFTTATEGTRLGGGTAAVILGAP